MAETSAPTSHPFLEIRLLLRSLGIASDAKKLILATVGLLLLSAGWSALSWALGGPEPWFTPIAPGQEIEKIPRVSLDAFRTPAWLMTEPFRVIVGPFAALFTRGIGPAIWFRSALMAVWAVIVWGILGGAIARIAVVQAAANERVGIGLAVRFALGKSASLVGALLTPLLAVGFFALFCALFGLLYRIPWGIGPVIGSILGFVPLLIGLVMAIILVGLAVGWPLMQATVAAEGEDAPDALSRSYSYVNQRLPRYAAHVVASWVIGSIGLVVAILFAAVVVNLADWGVGLGAPDPTKLSLAVPTFWQRIVGLLVHAWIYSYFWSASTLVYLILRRDVDGTPWHNVYRLPNAADNITGDVAMKPSTQPVEPAEVSVG